MIEDTMAPRAQDNPIASYFTKNRLDIILFDLDDTLVDTHTVFMESYAKVRRFVAERFPHISQDEFAKRWQDVNAEEFRMFSVNPNRWGRIVSRMRDAYGGEGWEEGVGYMMEVYGKVPAIKEGVLKTLQALRDAGIRMGIVTHAEAEWTQLKLNGNNLQGFFERVEHIDVNRHKNAGDWGNAIRAFGVEPSHVIVAGDNVQGGIVAAHDAGVRHLVWVDYEGGWAVYREGELPPGTIAVKKLDEILGIFRGDKNA